MKMCDFLALIHLIAIEIYFSLASCQLENSIQHISLQCEGYFVEKQHTLGASGD